MLGRASGRHLHALAHNRDPAPGAGSPTPPLDGRPAGARVATDARSPRSTPRSSRSSSESHGRMRAADRLGRTVVLRLRFDDSSRATRSQTLPYATANTRTILVAARELLAVAVPLIERQGITLVGVSISNLDDDRGQLRLPLDEAWSDTLDAALDEVRVRFGSAAITRAVLLGPRQGLTIPLLPTRFPGCKTNVCSLSSEECSSPSTRSTGSWTRSRSGVRCRRRGRAALFATSSISDGLACRCWKRSPQATAGSSARARPSPSSAAAPTRCSRRRSSSSSTSRRPGSRPAVTRSARSARCACKGLELGRLVPVARQSAGRAPRADRPADRSSRAGAARRAVGLDRRAALSRVRRRRAARGAQRPVRPALPRTAAGRTGASPSHRSARPRSHGACSKDGSAASASPRSPTSSASRRSRATARCPTPRRRLRCSCT